MVAEGPMKSVFASGVGGLAFVALVGCGAHGRDASFPTEAVATVAAATALEVAGALSQPTSPSGIDPDVPGYLQAPPDPPPMGASDPSHAAFDPVAPLTAIDRLDLSRCISSGALIGWGHARLTFEPSGQVSEVVVESTAGLPAGAVECIRAELASVWAAPFEGDAITIGASYFVR
jgi:hypothetical protein